MTDSPPPTTAGKAPPSLLYLVKRLEQLVR
jgi:hypothetical protein